MPRLSQLGGYVPILGGSYRARSPLAGAERQTNLYFEQNPEDAEEPTIVYPTPGTRLLASSGGRRVRGLWYASWGQLYAVIDSGIYYVSSAWALTLLGRMQTDSSPVSIVDNQLQLCIVDGSQTMYVIAAATNSIDIINASQGFLGAARVDFMDGFVFWNVPFTSTFQCTLNNTLTIDPDYQASKNGFSDPISTLIACRREIWLIGTDTTEIWYDAGGQTFPFAPIPGVFLEYGCIAPASVAKIGTTVYWLSQDKRGTCIVMKGEYYQATRVSNFAVEHQFSNYGYTQDALGYTWQQEGHYFYVLKFPSANRTWLFDVSSGQWSEWVTTDAQGNENAHLSNCCAFAYGVNVVGGTTDGNLYALDPTLATDWNPSGGSPIIRRRTLMHLVEQGKRVSYSRLQADLETGLGTGTTRYAPPLVPLVGFVPLWLQPPQWGVNSDAIYAEGAEPAATVPHAIPLQTDGMVAQGQPLVPPIPSPALESEGISRVGKKLGWPDVRYSKYGPALATTATQTQGSTLIADTQNYLPLAISGPGPDMVAMTLLDPATGLTLVFPGGDGTTQPAPGTSPPMITLRWSDDRGRTWIGSVSQDLGATGETYRSLVWSPLGNSRDRLFELSWNSNHALLGAWVGDKIGAT